jgi:uncharacterized MAPEG superfamily protein
MSAELSALVVAAFLGFTHIVLASHAISLQRGYRWTASARDAPVAPANGIAGRLERASRNFTETFAFYAAAIFIVHATRSETEATSWLAWTYVAARIAYLIAYSTGVFLLRSLIWNVASFAILALLLAPLVPFW